MRLMAHCRKRKSTGIYEYRRVIPAHLRPHVPDVPGFPTKSGRIEFTKSLETRKTPEANRLTAELDKVVDAALAEAERRQRGFAVSAPLPLTGNGSAPSEPVMIDRAKALAAIDRWQDRQIREAERRAFNGLPFETGMPEPADKLHWLISKLMYDRQSGWTAIECFELALRTALASEGISAQPGHPALRHLRSHFAAQWLYVLEKADSMRVGVFDWQPEEATTGTADDRARADVGAVGAPVRSSSPEKHQSLDDLLGDYLRQGDLTVNSVTMVKAIVRDLKAVVNNPNDAASITGAEIRSFRDLSERRPARLRRVDQGLNLHQLVQRYPQDDVQRLNRKTVSKYLDLLAALFEHGRRNQIVPANPVEFAKYPRQMKRVKQRERTSFTKAELKLVFTSPIFVGCKSEKSRHLGGTQIIKSTPYWMLLLGYLTGARLNEMGQAHIDDVKHDEVSGIHYLQVTLEQENPKAARKRLKTANSARLIPLHPALLKAGFIDYVNRQRRNGALYVFPDLSHGRSQPPTAALSKKLNRYLDQIGLAAKNKAFHSFRHTFKEAANNSGIPTRIGDRLTGHNRGDAADGYGEGPTLDVLNAALLKLNLFEMPWLGNVTTETNQD